MRNKVHIAMFLALSAAGLMLFGMTLSLWWAVQGDAPGAWTLVALAAGILSAAASWLVLRTAYDHSRKQFESARTAAQMIARGHSLDTVARDPETEPFHKLSEQVLRAGDIIRTLTVSPEAGLRIDDPEPGPLVEAARDLSNRLTVLHAAARELEEYRSALHHLASMASAISCGDLSGRTEDKGSPVSEALAAIVSGLSARLHPVAAAAGRIEIAGTGLEREIRTLSRPVTSLSAHSESTATGLAGIARQTGAVESTLRSVQASADEIARSSRSGAAAASEAVPAINSVRAQVQSSLKRVKRFGELSQELSRLTADLESVSERAGILSLNASLAAPVVINGERSSISEIGELSNRLVRITKQAGELAQCLSFETREASASLESLISDVVLSSALSERSGRAAGDIETLAARLQEEIASLDRAYSAQSAGIIAMVRTLGDVPDVCEQVRAGTRNLGDAVTRFGQAAAELSQAMSAFRLGVHPAVPKQEPVSGDIYVN